MNDIVRGSSVFPRNHINEEQAKEAFKNEWFKIGDVGALLPNGNLKIIERVKSLIKLEQGKYFSPERLEGMYSKCLLISQIFIHGDSNKSDVIAIIIPDKDAIKGWAMKQGV